MANNSYKIQLGVNLKVNDIKDRINKYNANSNNAKLKLGVKLDTKGISNQIKAINSKTPVKVELKLDAKNALKQINDIERKLKKLQNINIKINVTPGRHTVPGRDGIGRTHTG